MNTTEYFKRTIQAYLEERAMEDELFAAKYALAPVISIFFTNSSAYLVGCNDKKAAPKQAENVGVGSVIPRSVPANLAVNPDKK